MPVSKAATAATSSGSFDLDAAFKASSIPSSAFHSGDIAGQHKKQQAVSVSTLVVVTLIVIFGFSVMTNFEKYFMILFLEIKQRKQKQRRSGMAAWRSTQG